MLKLVFILCVSMSCGAPESGPIANPQPTQSPQIDARTVLGLIFAMCNSRAVADAKRVEAIQETSELLRQLKEEADASLPAVRQVLSNTKTSLRYLDDRESHCRSNCNNFQNKTPNCVKDCFRDADAKQQSELRASVNSLEKRVSRLAKFELEYASSLLRLQSVAKTVEDDYTRCMTPGNWASAYPGVDLVSAAAPASSTPPGLTYLPLGVIGHGTVTREGLQSRGLLSAVANCAWEKTPQLNASRGNKGECNLSVNLDTFNATNQIYCSSKVVEKVRFVQISFFMIPNSDTYYWRYSVEGHEVGVTGAWKDKPYSLGEDFVSSIQHEPQRDVAEAARSTAAAFAELVWSAPDSVPQKQWDIVCLPWRFKS